MTTLPPDPYLALGLSRDADVPTIKAKYRKLVLKCHPDKVTDESLKAERSEQFHKVQQAYELLGDEQRRSEYDATYKLELLRAEKRERDKEEARATFDERLHRPRQSMKIDPRNDRVAESSYLRNRPRARRPRLDTMEGLRGLLNGRYVVALCDTGADENFIAEDAAKEFGLDISYLWDDDRPSFVMGHGRTIFAIGSITATWEFENGGHSVHDVTFYVLKDCIFDVMIGSRFLSKTETMTEHRYRLCRIPKPGRALRTRVVNLCGTPSRRIRGSLKSEECNALPDSGAEPNLLSYEYVERRDWLLDMFPPPESCRLLQFADGSTETVSGRLRLRWSFVKGWGVAPPDADDYVDFDVLRGCPFDVILGSDFLYDTDAFVTHKDSFQDVVHDGPSGLNIVIWVTDKKKDKKKKTTKQQKSRSERAEEEQRAAQEQVDRELERRAHAEWKANRRRAVDGSLVDELDLEQERRDRWEANHPGTGYDRTYSYSTAPKRPSRTYSYSSDRDRASPTRERSQRTFQSSRSPSYNLTESNGRTYHPSKFNVARPRSPSPVGVKRRSSFSSGESRGRGPVTRTEGTKHSQSRPQPLNQQPYMDASRTNMRWTDTPHPSLNKNRKLPRVTEIDKRHSIRTIHEPPHGSGPSRRMPVTELDVGARNSNQTRTPTSLTRSVSSSSTRSGKAHASSDSSLSHSGGESSNTSVSNNSIKQTFAQRMSARMRTDDVRAH